MKFVRDAIRCEFPCADKEIIAPHPVVKEVLAAAGPSLDDIISRRGQVRYDNGLPQTDNRLGDERTGLG